jgi:hypothetical protein
LNRAGTRGFLGNPYREHDRIQAVQAALAGGGRAAG